MFVHIVVCFAHDSDQHVQNSDCCKEGGEDEEYVTQYCLLACVIFIHVHELSKGKQVLSDQCVNDRHINEYWDDRHVRLLISVKA